MLSDQTMLIHIGFAAQLSLAFVFLASAIPKIRNPRSFLDTVSAYGVVPHRAAAATAAVVVASELFAAICLVFGWIVWAALAVVMFALLAFAIAIGLNLSRGKAITCGCFGESSEQISSRSPARLGMMMATAILAASLFAFGKGPVTLQELRAEGIDGAVYVFQVSTFALLSLLLAQWLLYSRELYRVFAKASRPIHSPWSH